MWLLKISHCIILNRNGGWQAEWIWIDGEFFWVNFFHCTVCLLCNHSGRTWYEKGKDLHTYSHKKSQLWSAHLKRQQDWNVKSKQQQCKMAAAVSQPALSSQTWCKMSFLLWITTVFMLYWNDKCYDFSVTSLHLCTMHLLAANISLKMLFWKSHLALLTGNCILNSEQYAAA